MATTTIDNTDFMILKCINDANRPLWKNKIHKRIGEAAETLLLAEKVSVQTVGRRVDQLNEEGYVENAIISPDELKRDLIIAFKVTEKGQQAIKRQRNRLLKRVVRDELFTEDGDMQVNKDTLVELVGDEFRLETEMRDRLMEEYTEEEIITFLTMYYTKQEVISLFDDETLSEFHSIMADQNKMGEKITI